MIQLLKYMKYKIIIFCVLVVLFTSCCPQNTDILETELEITNVAKDIHKGIKISVCEFNYKGHLYIWLIPTKGIIHAPHCPCYTENNKNTYYEYNFQ